MVTRRRLRFLQIILGSVVAFLVASCGLSGKVDEPSTEQVSSLPANTSSITQLWLSSRWLNQEACSIPCWEGVTPGSTDAEAAMRIWEESDLFLSLDNSEPLGKSGGSISWKIQIESGEVIAGDALYKLLHTSYLIYQIRVPYPTTRALSELIQNFGQPTYVVAIVHEPPDGVDQDYYEIHIIWEQGISFSTAGETPAPEIGQNLQLGLANYFSTESEDFKRDIFHFDPNLFIPWQGFGPFDHYRGDK